MAKFSKFKAQDFDQTPGKVKDQRTGNYFSFYVSPKKKQDLLKLPCDLHIASIMDLDIINDRGRQEGSQVIYDADQTYNYLSQSERYEKAIGIQAASVKQEGKKTTYLFCSSRSPSGMWEVVIDESGKATFIYFTKVFLTIIVPRAFRLSEVTQLVTDSSTVLWTQIKGNRDVFIETNTSFNPSFQYSNDCFGEYCNDTKELEPIILRVESDNPLLFADLVIQNRLIENWYGLSRSANTINGLSCRKVNTTTLQIAPTYTQRAYIWQGENLKISWQNPSCDQKYLTNYALQILDPPYREHLQTLEPIADIAPNRRYRISANYKIYGIFEKTAVSEPFGIVYNPNADFKLLLGNDSNNKILSCKPIASSVHKIKLEVKNKNLTDQAINYLGIVKTKSLVSKVNFTARSIILSDVANTKLSVAKAFSKYTKIDLGGVIIG